MIRKKRRTVAVLHHVGGLMGQHHPNLPRIILEVVGTQKQGVARRMKRAEQGLRTILGHHRVRARSSNQSGVATDAIPSVRLGATWMERSQQRQHERDSDRHPT